MTRPKSHTKYIFVTGGVCSSLGKGILSASVGALLETRGLRVSLTKADPYINVDPGTMNPFQHGEVFVTDDGAETDLDIGHYQRFTKARLTRLNSFSTGQVYDAVLSKERRGEYLGGTVQVIPHVTDQIKQSIYRASEGADIAIVEIGGTVGDIEGQPYLEAIRQIRHDLGESHVLYIHLTLVPYIHAAKELKTKPTQHSVKDLRQIGIQPHMIVCRSDRSVPEDVRRKIALFCDVKPDCVVEAPDVAHIYKVPLILHEQGLDQKIVDQLGIWTGSPDLSNWQRILSALENPVGECRVAIVGKYTHVVDSYKSIEEALIHGGIANRVRVNIEYLDASLMTAANAGQICEPYDGVIVPGGFGGRGIEGKIHAISAQREGLRPFLGICLGMQLAAVEFARSRLGLRDANSQEFAADCENSVIHLMADQEGIDRLGGTMRLGAYPCALEQGTKAYQAYGVSVISERHRHRYEFNNAFRTKFVEAGVRFSGLSPDGRLVEMMELADHPWFVACQFHPELKSRPMDPHPLFRDFVRAAVDHRRGRAKA